MGGLDKIIEEIKDQANAEAGQILKEADEYCDEYMKEITDKVADEVEAFEKKEKSKRDLYDEKVKSGALFRERNEILKTKQQCINEVIKEAEYTICNLETKQYFDFLSKLFEANFDGTDGEMFFGKEDLERMPEEFKEKIKAIADNKGAKVNISDKTKNIKNGFILVYGEIEENCTIQSLFDEKSDALRDIVNKELFS
ncbi:V-type ATP synthase subunit E [Eubacterium sp.]